MLSRRAGAPSVTQRFRGILVGLFGIGGIVALVAAWIFAGAAADEAYDRLLVSAAVQIADTVDVGGVAIDVYPPDSAFETLALAEDDRFFYSVRGPRNELLTGYASLPQATRTHSPDLAQQDATFAGAHIRLVTLTRNVQSSGRSERVAVTIGETRLARQGMQRELFAKFAGVTLGLIVLGLIAALLAARVAVRPLAALEKALSLRAPHDLSPLTVEAPRETTALVAEINRLMARLGLRLETLRQFSAVAAHQLRTPLAAMSSQIDLISHDREEGARAGRVERLRIRVLELNRLVHQLLGHAMIAYRGEAMPREEVELIALARSILLHEIPQSLDRDLKIDLVTKRESVLVTGDAVMLREAIVNLINNAVLHGAPTMLRVIVTLDGDQVALSVVDDGGGIERSRWNTVNMPFSSKRTDGVGAGLGLSIARETASAHGGTLGFAFTDEHHFSATLRLPAAR